MFEDGKICRRNYYDDRGFVSSTVIYENGIEMCIRDRHRQVQAPQPAQVHRPGQAPQPAPVHQQVQVPQQVRVHQQAQAPDVYKRQTLYRGWVCPMIFITDELGKFEKNIIELAENVGFKE